MAGIVLLDILTDLLVTKGVGDSGGKKVLALWAEDVLDTRRRFGEIFQNARSI